MVDSQDQVSHQSHRPFRSRRTARRHRPDGPQDHRRYLRRHGPSRRRRVLRQGSDEGRSLGLLHGALHRQEHRGVQAGHRAAKCSWPTRSAWRSRSRCMVNTFGTGVIPDEQFTELVRANFQSDAARHHRHAEAAPSDLPQDGRVRPLRPHRRYLHVGSDGQGRGAQGTGRRGRGSVSKTQQVEKGSG